MDELSENIIPESKSSLGSIKTQNKTSNIDEINNSNVDASLSSNLEIIIKNKSNDKKGKKSISDLSINKFLNSPSIFSNNCNPNQSNLTNVKKKRSKQQNNDLEKHIRHHQQNLNDFYRQDSFLKKFSTRSQNQISHISENQAMLSNNENDLNKARPNKNRFSYAFSSPLIAQKNKLDAEIIDNNNSNKNLNIDPNNNENLENSDAKNEESKLKENNDKMTIDKNDQNNTLSKSNEKLKTSSSLLFNYNNTSYKNNRKKDFLMKQSLQKASTSSISDTYSITNSNSIFKVYFNKLLIKCNYFVLSPDDNGTFMWLIILNACVLYNIWLIIARQSFENLEIMFSFYWRVIDGISDSIYLIDVLVQFRTGYLEQGLLVYDSKKLAVNYLKSKKFLLDMFSLAPFELIQLKYNYNLPMLRFPRFFKLYRTIELYYITESRSLYPNVWRVANLTHILFLLGHWFAGFYFLISKAEGFKGFFC
jgi:hypothetical protein